MRVAIVHPWFWELGGGEKVIEALVSMYPEADVFVLALKKDGVPESLRDRKIQASFLNRVPGIARLRRPLFFLYPTAIELLDMRPYDLVLCSSGPATLGVNVRQDATQICYCHSPGRSFWDAYAERQQSLPFYGRLAYTALATYVRTWEFAAAQRVDAFAANSLYIAHRIKKYWQRDAAVIYPPVDTTKGILAERPSDYYLSLGRLGDRKRLDLLIYACNRLKRRLILGGTGPEEKHLKAIAGPTVEFLGWVPEQKVSALYANCRAFLFAADEDFGIAPVEAQASGRPVIAYGHGGALETVRSGSEQGNDTGVFFPEQTVESVIQAILRFEAIEERFTSEDIRAHAREFDTSVFIGKMRSFVEFAVENTGRGASY